ncbi:hypothetical protein [Enterococcus sp. CSURQ0835]|uniref:hypothetical protein n=1 Tax=Enterococcus sp. CSURQ0835 TaxID=2681394 RepID=UPI001358A396|nr:hypothetical protein [Enterococcus sp. CSURQ0835]
MRRKLSPLLVISLLAAATGVRFYLALHASYYLAADASFDDQLFLNYCTHLLKGEWLGPYNNTTLAKGISYAGFMYLGNELHLPYPWLLGSVNFAASVAASCAFYAVYKRRWVQGVVYLFFLYSPLTLTAEYATRIYRNALVGSTVTFLIAGMIGLYATRASVKKMLPWLLLVTGVLPIFWYLREDSLWLLPFLGVGLFLTGLKILLADKRRIMAVLMLSLPFLSLAATTQLIKAQNEKHYGIALVNDRTQGAFGRLMERLIRIKTAERDDAKVWVSKAQLKKATAVSPTLRKLDLDWIYHGSPWSSGEDIAGDIIFWALRDTATRAGLYQDARSTENFWHQVVTELDRGYEQGQLQTKQEWYLTRTGDGKKTGDLPIVFEFIVAGMRHTIFYQGFAQGREKSTGPASLIAHDEKILRTNLRQSKVHWATRLANASLAFQQLLVKILLPAAIGGVIAKFIFQIKRRRLKELFDYSVIFFGLLLTYFVFLIGIAWFCSWDPNRMVVFMLTYSGAGVIMVQFMLSWGLAGWLTERGKFFDDHQTIEAES